MTISTVTLDNDPACEIFDLFKNSTASKPAVFADDPVVLSCAAARIGGYPRLEEVHPTEQDREMAEKVRQHYINKLVFRRLQGQPISAFQEKLGAFLTGSRPLLENEIGILYQLPYFYVEDIETQSLIENTAHVIRTQSECQTQTLRPYKNFKLKRRSGTIQQYWWVDNDNRPYCLNIRDADSHQSLFQSIWNFDSIKVAAHMYVKPFLNTDRFYYKLVGARLLAVS